MTHPHRLLGFALLLAAPWIMASAQPAPVTCRQTLDSIDAKTRRNYAGFLLEVTGARRLAYDAMVASARRQATDQSLPACYGVLRNYINWFADPHLFVYQSPVADSATTALRRDSLRMGALGESAIRAQLATRSRMLDPIEGIWYEGPLRVGVVRDTAAGAGRFIAIVLQSDTAAWPTGAVRAEFTRDPAGTYTTRLFTRAFAVQELTARIHKRVLLRFSPGIWGKAFPVAAPDTATLDPVDAHRPRLSLRAQSVLLSVPSHDPANARMIDSLVRANDAAIRSRPLLIVDLRGNEGGASFTTRALNPYVASTAKRVTPFDSGSAVMLSSPSQITYARRFTGTDTSAFVRSLVARMEVAPGALVPMETDVASAAPADAVHEGAWRVAVLVDGGTVSAAEVLVLRALRSMRAVVIGEPTAGALDYQSVNIVSLGTGDRRWALGYPTIAAHGDLPARGMRGRGIAPDVSLDWTELADPIAEVERRLLSAARRP